MKKFIDINAEARKIAKDDFEKDFYNRMSNSVFRKTMENVRNRADIEILNGNDKGDEKRLLRHAWTNRSSMVYPSWIGWKDNNQGPVFGTEAVHVRDRRVRHV